MPYFRLETNIPQAQIPTDLPVKLCDAIAKTLNKPPSYCAATVIGGVNMVFAGTNEPTAQATLMSIGAMGVEQNKKHSKVLFDLIGKELGIPSDRMYIHFINEAASDVGHKGITLYGIF